MNIDWKAIHKKAEERHNIAREEASFMMNALMCEKSINSVAFLFPEETRNFFKSQRLVKYVEKRMKRIEQ